MLHLGLHPSTGGSHSEGYGAEKQYWGVSFGRFRRPMIDFHHGRRPTDTVRRGLGGYGDSYITSVRLLDLRLY